MPPAIDDFDAHDAVEYYIRAESAETLPQEFSEACGRNHWQRGQGQRTRLVQKQVRAVGRAELRALHVPELQQSALGLDQPSAGHALPHLVQKIRAFHP